MTAKELLDTLTEVEINLSKGPWSLGCVGEAIRHVYRNVDHEQYCSCGNDEPAMFGKYDGDPLAILRNALPDIRQHLSRLTE